MLWLAFTRKQGSGDLDQLQWEITSHQMPP